MSSSTTITIRVASDVKDKLERLAEGTRRSKSFLAAEAVAAYVERELAIVDAIERGFADVAAGNIVSHDAAMAEIYDVIERRNRRV